MSFWTELRDTIENVGLGVADYFTGGAASVLGGLRSKSAQDSILGKIVGIGGELYGLGNLAYGAYNALAGLSGAGGLSGAANLGTSSTGLISTADAGNALSGVSGASGSGSLLGGSNWASDIGGYLVNHKDAISSLAQIYQGMQAQRNAGQLEQLAQQGNALGPYRAQYAQQLQQLQQNPGSVMNLPGAQAGIEAINRDAAARGYFGSGNLASALGAYGNQLYQQQLQNLSSLAGNNINPYGAIGAYNSAGQSQASGLGLMSSGIQGLLQ